MEKKIIYIIRPELESLPPSMSQIATLSQCNQHVLVVTPHVSKYIIEFLRNCKIDYLSLNSRNSYQKNKIIKIIEIIRFRNLIRRILNEEDERIIWIGSVDTAMYLRDIISLKEKIVFNIFELYDEHPYILKRIKKIAQASKAVIVPEYNRAHILKVWMKLARTPVVIPNKPVFLDVLISEELKIIVEKLKKINKKIILYQGWIGKHRDVSKIAEALGSMENSREFVLVLMGAVITKNTIEHLTNIFPSVIHIPYIPPPQHLFVTEIAYIGIAMYDDSSLNNIFCAPNKIYEYAQKGVPILARDIPGLANTVGVAEVGICVDMENREQIINAINSLDSNHDKYVRATRHFSDLDHVKENIKRIIRACDS